MVDGRRSFYVLDPSDNLANTQKRLSSVIEKFGWKGVTARHPTREEFIEALATNDLFL